MHLFRRTKDKVFCIGCNKTGTTSLELALRQFGYRLGEQSSAELFLEDWAQRDFRGIVKLCRSVDAFQDVPFSLPYTYQALDSAYPGAKFILSVRGSSNEWYDSLTRFHAKLVGKGRIPSAADLQDFSYRKKGWLWQFHQLVYGVDETTLYDRRLYCDHYEQHNLQVWDYFRHRPNDLLTINIATDDAMERLCTFLSIKYTGQTMPHENKSR